MKGQMIALITDKATTVEYEDPKTESGQLLAHLREKGFCVSFQIWDDKNVNWSEFDAIVMNTPWDYKEKIVEFKAWLDEVEKTGILILNPPEIIHWNSDKTYLKEMEEKGVKITPTLWFEKGEKLDVDLVFAQFKTDKIIIKPQMSTNNGQTFVLAKDEAIEKREYFERLFKENYFMIQPVLQEIDIQGEWSFVFLNGKFSHSVIKTGGKIERIEAPLNLVENAEKIVERFAKGCLYSRVDGLVLEGEFALRRLEVTAPNLYLSYSNGGGMERYSHGLAQKILESDKKKMMDKEN